MVLYFTKKIIMSHDPRNHSDQYADLVLRKHFLLLSLLKAVVLPNIFLEIIKPCFFMNRKFKTTLKCPVTFDQFHVPFLNKNISKIIVCLPQGYI